MCFDLFHIHRFSHTSHLVDLSAIIEQIRGVHNTSSVGLKVNHIDLVETKQCHKKPNVGQSKGISSYVPLPTQNLLRAIKRSGELGNGFVVCFLGGCKSTSAVGKTRERDQWEMIGW